MSNYRKSGEYRYCTFCDKRHRVYMDHDAYDVANIGPNEGKVMCHEQVSYEREYATPVFHIKYGCRYKYSVGRNLMESDDNGSDVYGTDKALMEYAKSLGWHSTDAWRGYMAGKAPAGWTDIIDTWFCPQDGHNLDGVSDLFQQAWEKAATASEYNEWTMTTGEEQGEGSEFDDLEVIAAFPRTSNVFSTCLEVYIKDTPEQRTLFDKWIGAVPTPASQEEEEAVVNA